MRTLVSGDLRARSTAIWSARRHVGFLARHLDARRAWNLVRCLAEMKLRRSMPLRSASR